MLSDLAPTPERPWRYLTVTVLLATAASAGTLWLLRVAPGAALLGQPGHHGQTSGTTAECLDCHVPFVGTPASRCLSPGCHGNLATGTPPRTGPAMPERFHGALRDVACGQCHEEHRPRGAARLFDHRIIPDETRSACRRCHHAAERDSHARTDSVTCGTCHGWATWAGAEMDHRRVPSEPCELCHSPPKSNEHKKVAGTCDDCHGTHAWTVVGPQDAAK